MKKLSHEKVFFSIKYKLFFDEKRIFFSQK